MSTTTTEPKPTSTSPTANKTELGVVTQRRSAQRYNNSSNQNDLIIAPGFGTVKDLERLARDLSEGTDTVLPVEAVKIIMTSRGRGIRSSKRGGNGGVEGGEAEANNTTTITTPVSSAWADFMKEEGVEAKSTTTDTKKSKRKVSTLKEDSTSRTYTLASSSSPKPSSISVSKNKKKKGSDEGGRSVGGVLVQAGTLDCSIVGRSKKFSLNDPHCLPVPTIILSPSIRIASVHSAGHACHSIAITTTGQVYGWGRNESNQLGAALPSNVYQPALLNSTTNNSGGEGWDQPVRQAAVGKAHTVFLMNDGTLISVGANKLGQCGVKLSMETINNPRSCVFVDDDDSGREIVQIACGEDFSVALDSDGFIYTTGAAEYGQLGNGETGEYFIAANKLGFANCNAFTKRTTFCHAPDEKLFGAGEKSKVVPLPENIRIQQIACGKRHTLVLEAESDHPPRVWSFGCGDYGVLGHGIQADEYFPRLVGTIANLKLPSQGASRVAISAGQHCSLLQTSNGHVYYWGKHRSVGEATMRPTLIDALANNQHVVMHAAAGGQTVVCCTLNAQTVAWGQGMYGELGIGPDKKSSAKPTFVDVLNGCRIASLSCGYGHTLYVVRNDDKEDKTSVEKLPVLDPAATETLMENEEKVDPPTKVGKKK